MVSDKFRLISGGNLPSPGKCWSCGTCSRPCIDFGSNLEWFGAVLLCIDCVREAATVLPSLPILEDREKIEALRKVQELDARLADFREHVASFWDVPISQPKDEPEASSVFGSFLTAR